MIYTITRVDWTVLGPNGTAYFPDGDGVKAYKTGN